MSDLTIEDTWFVAGMKGTGSNTLVAEDVFVPDAPLSCRCPRAHPATTTRPSTPTRSLYRSSFIPVLALMLAGPQLGLAARRPEHSSIEKAPKRDDLLHDLRRQTDSTAVPDCRSPRRR